MSCIRMCLSHILVVLCCAIGIDAEAQRTESSAGLAHHPPTVSEGWLEQGASGKTVLRVRFATTRISTLENKLVLEPNPGEKIVLCDDGKGVDDHAGDGLYSATIDTKFSGLQKKHLAALRSVAERRPDERRLQDLFSRDRFSPGKQERKDLPTLLKSFRDIPIRSDLLIKVPLFPVGDVDAIDPDKSLMITDLRIIEDSTRTFNPCDGVPSGSAGTANGRWTFGFLFRQLCAQSPGSIDPRVFADSWLQQMEEDQLVNGFVIEGRTGVTSRLREIWPEDDDGLLDLDRAPFRLLAIVNRVDLRDNLVYGGGSAGEARFVFGVIDPDTCLPKEMAVIFEYGVPRSGCRAVRAWAKRWAHLSQLDLDDPHELQTYLDELQSLTDDFTLAGEAPGKPNNSPLNQLRTNEFLLGGGNGERWELREFVLSGTGWDQGFLRIDTCKNEVDGSHNRSESISRFIDLMPTTVGASAPSVPLLWEGARFMAGNSIVPIAGGVWEGPHSNRPPASTPEFVDYANRRFNFAVNTCSGCHRNETDTSFYHIEPTGFGLQPKLSAFLVGDGAGGPLQLPDELVSFGAPVREFNDLQRRRVDLANLVASLCIFQVPFQPLTSVH